MRGSVVRFEQDNDGDYIITVVKPSSGTLFDAGDKLVMDMYVMDGRVNCTWSYTSVADTRDAFLNVYNNGQTLQIQHAEHSDQYMTLRKI